MSPEGDTSAGRPADRALDRARSPGPGPQSGSGPAVRVPGPQSGPQAPGGPKDFDLRGEGGWGARAAGPAGPEAQTIRRGRLGEAATRKQRGKSRVGEVATGRRLERADSDSEVTRK